MCSILNVELVERWYYPIRSIACEAHFTYYHYLIYDKSVKNAEGIAVWICTLLRSTHRYKVSIMKSQEGRNLCRYWNPVQFPSHLTTAMCPNLIEWRVKTIKNLYSQYLIYIKVTMRNAYNQRFLCLNRCPILLSNFFFIVTPPEYRLHLVRI